MPWKMIFFLLIVFVIVLFIFFNIDTSSDISFGFVTYHDVPIFISLFLAFTAGVVITIPMILLGKGRKKREAKKFFSKKQGKKFLKRSYPISGKEMNLENEFGYAAPFFFSALCLIAVASGYGETGETSDFSQALGKIEEQIPLSTSRAERYRLLKQQGELALLAGDLETAQTAYQNASFVYPQGDATDFASLLKVRSSSLNLGNFALPKPRHRLLLNRKKRRSWERLRSCFLTG